MRYFHRTLMAAFIVFQSQLSGTSIIQNFQNTFYAILGITGRQSLLVSGIYGFMGVIGTIIYLGIVADRWPRARTLWTGSLALSVSIAICMALSATYGKAGESNMAGARASITFIFIYSATFAIFFNTMIRAVPSELFPTFLRSKGMAFAVSSKSVVAIVLSQITPLALAEVSWRFCALFIACNTAASVLYFFFLPETGGKTLEEFQSSLVMLWRWICMPILRSLMLPVLFMLKAASLASRIDQCLYNGGTERLPKPPGN